MQDQKLARPFLGPAVREGHRELAEFQRPQPRLQPPLGVALSAVGLDQLFDKEEKVAGGLGTSPHKTSGSAAVQDDVADAEGPSTEAHFGGDRCLCDAQSVSHIRADGDTPFEFREIAPRLQVAELLHKDPAGDGTLENSRVANGLCCLA